VPDISGICKQSDFVDLPDDELSKTLDRTLKSQEYIRRCADRLSGAVRIATESFDDMGPVGVDPRWNIFQEFHDYLEKTYPLM
jgi:Gly-Xaa carboxypeptidase